MDAIILCAGEGTRLRPLTLHKAKPVIPVVCEPILSHILGELEKYGIFRAAANIWHRQEDFLDFCEASGASPVRLSLVPEKTLLGTGGGISNVAAHLQSTGPVLVHNGDIYTDADLSSVIREHRASGAMLTLLTRDGEPEIETIGNEVIDIAGRLGKKGENAWKFTGISIWDSEALEYLPRPGVFGDAVDTMVSILKAAPGAIKAHNIGDALWTDIGTPDEYLELHRRLLGKEVYSKENIELPPGVRVDGFLCLCRNARIGAGSVLEDVIVWPDSEIPQGSVLNRAVVGPFGILRI